MVDEVVVPAAVAAPVVSTASKKVNPIVQFLTSLWNKVESVDSAINNFVSRLTNGHSTIAIIIVAVVYWLIKPFIGLILGIPAFITKVILQALEVAVPALINAIPYIAGVFLALLVIVEIVNLFKKK